MSKVDILIPTFNRVEPLAKNLELIFRQIEDGSLWDCFQILVSDNASTDGTVNALSEIQRSSKIALKVYQQDQNIGLEKNAIFLLGKSASKYVMFLGDDDYLPSGFLLFVNSEISSSGNVSAVIPGNSALYADGSLTVARSGRFPINRYAAGFLTSLRLSGFGHQLSGLVLRREGLFETYCEHEKLRNIYPFITFLSINCMRGCVTYAPKYQVAITVFNSKDWKYDDSGLLTEIFKNYYIVFESERIKSYLSCCIFVLQQPWRLRLHNPRLACKSLKHLILSDDVSVGFKFTLPILYLLGFLTIGIRVGKRLLSGGRLRRR